MKRIFGTLGFFITGTGVFRLIYGRWPSNQVDFFQWLASDSRARWAIGAGLVAGMFGGALGRRFSLAPNAFDGSIREAAEYGKLGLLYHQERKLNEAVDKFKRAIALYQEAHRENDAAPAYACLGKVYFDLGEPNLAEENLNEALSLYRQRLDGQEAITSLETLLDLISEWRQNSDVPHTYDDPRYPFSFCIPEGWLKQKLLPQFLRTGGRVVISHTTHAATFNVSVGSLDRPEWSLAEVRVVAAKEFLEKSRDRVGAIEVQTFVPVSGEENVVVAEYDTRTKVSGAARQRRNGFFSILHNGIEYTIQWSAEAEYEEQVRQVVASFQFHSPPH